MSDAENRMAAFEFAGTKSMFSNSILRNAELRHSSCGASRTFMQSFGIWIYETAFVDRSFALLLVPFVSIILMGILPIALICQGRPFFYRAKRMKSSNQEFLLWKIRTMHPDHSASLSVMGGDQLPRVTKLGRILRYSRLDEIPQIYNILAGDIRFIGPRPPLRKYVEIYPDTYARVLRVKPGITGLATVLLHKRETRLLEACATAEETDDLYRRACIPIKARLDILYMHRRSLRLDMFVIYRTFASLLPKSSNAARGARPV